MKEELSDLHEHSVVFASPPWGGTTDPQSKVYQLTAGGPGYRSDAVFDLLQMQPYSLIDLIMPLEQHVGNIALYLPRTSNLRQLAGQVKKGTKMTVTHYCMEGASKVDIMPNHHSVR